MRFTLGQRVVVRFRLPVAATDPGPHLSDVVGEVIEVTPDSVTVAGRQGPVRVVRSSITAAKAVPPRPVRRAAAHRALSVADLHRVMTEGNPPLEREWIGAPHQGWMLRAARGYTRRANSLLPLGDPGMPVPEALAQAERWYASRGLPPLVMLPLPTGAAAGTTAVGAELLAAGYTGDGPEVEIMTAAAMDTPEQPPAGVTITQAPSPDRSWVQLADPRVAAQPEAARAVLTGPASGVFLTAHADGEPIGVARVALASGWGGIFNVHVAPAARRRGVGRALSVAALSSIAGGGARSAYLQVESTNPARSLYTALDFETQHVYRYLVAPPRAAGG